VLESGFKEFFVFFIGMSLILFLGFSKSLVINTGQPDNCVVCLFCGVLESDPCDSLQILVVQAYDLPLSLLIHCMPEFSLHEHTHMHCIQQNRIILHHKFHYWKKKIQKQVNKYFRSLSQDNSLCSRAECNSI
jgi:hypothetical protein